MIHYEEATQYQKIFPNALFSRQKKSAKKPIIFGKKIFRRSCFAIIRGPRKEYKNDQQLSKPTKKKFHTPLIPVWG